MLLPETYRKWKRNDFIVQLFAFLLPLFTAYGTGIGIYGAVLILGIIIGIVQIFSTWFWFILGKEYEVLPARKVYHSFLLIYFFAFIFAGWAFYSPSSFFFDVLFPLAGFMALVYLILTAVETYRMPVPKHDKKN